MPTPTSPSRSSRRRATVSDPGATARCWLGWRAARPRSRPLTIFQAIILGLTQGITEFAPVSSSGHLILVPWLFGWPILNNADLNKTFDVALHIGTLIGAVAYFRRDIWRYLLAWFASIRERRIGTTDQRIAWALVIGTIPGVIAGALLEDVIQKDLGQPWIIAVMLAVFGVVLYLVDRAFAQDRGLDDVTPMRGWWLGVAQALALQPGVSRSGVTITAARIYRFERATAARVSFLLALPIIAGAGVYKGIDLVKTGIPDGFAGPFVAGIVAAAISGFVVIWWLLGYLRRRSLAVFMWYRLAVAALVLIVIATGFRSATI